MPIPLEKHKWINEQWLQITWMEGTKDTVSQWKECVETCGEKEDLGRITVTWSFWPWGWLGKSYRREIFGSEWVPSNQWDEESRGQLGRKKNFFSGSGFSIQRHQGFPGRKSFICEVSCIVLLNSLGFALLHETAANFHEFAPWYFSP